MKQGRISLKKMREMLTKRKAMAEKKRDLFLEGLSREKFCELLNTLPTSYTLKLKNIREDFNGDWERTILDGQTAWQKEDKILLNLGLFPFKEGVLAEIEKRERNLFKKYYLKSLRKKGEVTQTLTKEKLQELYSEQNKSLGDIGNEFGCARQTVLRLMKKYGIQRKTQSKARIEAMKKGKFERFEYHEINENFFSEWSPEMAWVLGLLFTDGNVFPGRISLSSVDLELLEKVRKLLNSSKPVVKITQTYDKSKFIYRLEFYREKMRDDLGKLRLHQRKSLNMIFPVIPEQYMRHFIRGCWDGDGSIFISDGKINANYTCGSLKFIEVLVQELYKIGIHKTKLLLDKTDASLKRSYSPVGRYPLTIHKEKRSKSYYIKLDSRNNLEKLFHYFYDDVDESIYFSRKYMVFSKGLKLAGKEETEQLTLDWNFK